MLPTIPPAWLAPVDGYCERLDAGLWAEPLNALTNAAFLVAAFLCWRWAAGDRAVRALAVLVAGIGIGSAAFHTAASRLTAVMDVVPIVVFILAYFGLALRRFLAAGPWTTGIALAGFLAASPVVVTALRPWIGGTAGYAPAMIALLAVAGLVALRPGPAHRQAALGLAVTGLVFAVSMTARALDLPLCDRLPIGTHFVWHLLNAVTLALLLVVAFRFRARLTAHERSLTGVGDPAS